MRELTTALMVSFLALWFTNVVLVFTSALPVHESDLGKKKVSLVVLPLKWLQPHRDQKSPPLPFTSCGICSPGCINLVPSFTHLLSGWQVDM